MLVGLGVATVLLIGGCGADGDEVSKGPTSATGGVTSSGSSGTGAAVEGSAATVDAVMATIQAHFDEDFARGTPPPGVTGPTVLICTDSGSIDVGGVLGCGTRTPTEPGAEVEDGNVVAYVLDASGRVAFDGATDIPGSTEGLLADYQRVPKGLFCRDLLDPDVDAYPFRQLSTPAVNFFWSLIYWSLEGRPDRMDADQDGVPCETLYESDVVAEVLAGGRIGP